MIPMRRGLKGHQSNHDSSPRSLRTSRSEVGVKSRYHRPTATNGSGVRTHTTSSASRASSAHVDGAPTGTADDHSCRLLLPHRHHGGAHRRSGGQTVVHEDDGLVGQPIGARSPRYSRSRRASSSCSLLRHRIDHVAGNAERVDDLVVHQANAAARDRAHRELLVSGHAELADDEHVERHAERPRHLARDGHTAARQGQHDHVVAIAVAGQTSQPTARRLRPGREMAAKTPGASVYPLYRC